MSNYAVVDPATGETVKEYPTIGDDALRDAIARAHQAHAEWAASTTVAERAALVVASASSTPSGASSSPKSSSARWASRSSRRSARLTSAGHLRLLRRHGEALLADEPITLSGGDGTAIIRRSSFGVLLGIMPWNFPYYQVARFAGPNLVIGNTILLKHAPQCPESAAAIEQMYQDAGFPADAYINISRRRPDRVGDRRPPGPRRVAHRLGAGRRGGR